MKNFMKQILLLQSMRIIQLSHLGIKFIQGNAKDLSFLPDESFDAVIFPMNGLDLLPSIIDRERCLKEMARKVSKGGILAFSSHNPRGYLSYKTSNKKLPLFTKPYIFEKEKVIGGGVLFKGTPQFIIKHTQKTTGLEFAGFTADCRNILERKISKNLVLAQFLFPYLFYVFKKS